MNEKFALKRLFKIVNGSTPKSDIASYWDGDVVWVTPEDLGKLQSDSIATTRRQISREGLASCGASVVPPESIILSTRAPIGNIAIAQVPLCTNQGCKSLVPRSCNVFTRYFFYQVQALKRELNVLGNGTTFLELSAEKLGQVVLSVPTHERQKEIADFLDRESTEADALVAKYERLIELLEEKRIALITQAVTKGLDPNVTMKDSGVPYIGLIPIHWNTPAVWMTFSLGRGRVLSHDDIRRNPGEYPVYSSQTENNGEMGRIGTFDFDGEYLTWTTDGANAGTVFVRDGRFNCTNVCGTLKPYSPSTNLKYYQNLLAVSTKAYVRLDINPKLMNDVMARIRLPQPPVQEQLAIQTFLDDKLRPSHEIKEKLQTSINLVREHRAALITAAVTGQIDVNTYRSKNQPMEVPAS